MNISILFEDQQSLKIGLSGRLTTDTAPDLEKVLDENLGSVTDLTFDLDGLEYTSSAGLRVFLSAQKTMNKQGSMKLINVNPDITDIFDITGFSDILTIE